MKTALVLIMLAASGLLFAGCSTHYTDEADDLPWENTAGRLLQDPDSVD